MAECPFGGVATEFGEGDAPEHGGGNTDAQAEDGKRTSGGHAEPRHGQRPVRERERHAHIVDDHRPVGDDPSKNEVHQGFHQSFLCEQLVGGAGGVQQLSVMLPGPEGDEHHGRCGSAGHNDGPADKEQGYAERRG